MLRFYYFEKGLNLYFDYLKEIYGKYTLVLEHSFAVYSMNAETLYLEDLYIHPNFRDQGEGNSIFEEIIGIAKSNGCSKLLTSITLTNKYRDKNMQIFLHKGFSLNNVGQNIIYLVKEI